MKKFRRSLKKYPKSWALFLGTIAFVLLTVFVSYNWVINAVGFIGFIGGVFFLEKALEGNDK